MDFSCTNHTNQYTHTHILSKFILFFWVDWKVCVDWNYVVEWPTEMEKDLYIYIEYYFGRISYNDGWERK
jgi:hypothetical protein